MSACANDLPARTQTSPSLNPFNKAKKIAVAFDVTITIDGHELGPCYNTLANAWTFTVNDAGKITVWEAMWDSGDAQTGHCMGLVMAHKKTKEL